MSDPEEKERHRRRLKVRSKIARSLEDRKFRQRKVEDKKKKVDVSKLSHREFVEMIQDRDSENS